METKKNELHFGGISTTELVKKYDTPLYIYEADTIRERYHDLADNINYPNLSIHYAAKANSNPEILKIIKKEGGKIETVSKGMVALALKLKFKPSDINFTCNGIDKEELQFLIDKKINVNLDSISQLEKWGQLNPGSKVSLRFNLDIGSGHHIYTTTGGRESKFGIHISRIKDAKRIAKKYNLTITGIQQHIGSGIPDPKTFDDAAEALLKVAHQFPNLDKVNFGGGFDIPYKPKDKRLDLKKLGSGLDTIMSKFCQEYGKDLEVVIEPGRYLVAESGTLLTKVTDIKFNPSKTFVSTDTGMNHLVRPAMYFSYHKVVNASRVKGRNKKVTVVGNICESADMFNKDASINNPKEGDILAILDAGAYGFTMSSYYNSRVRPAEVLIDGGKAKVIRKRLDIEEALPYF